MAKATSKTGSKNPNKARNGAENGRWRGGRVLQNGYVKVRKPGHPKADSSQYVYEHRLESDVTSGKQQVHHLDGDRKNNSPDNLRVEKDLGTHNKERAGEKKDDKKKPKRKPVKKDTKSD
jgi:hypothetical protein